MDTCLPEGRHRFHDFSGRGVPGGLLDPGERVLRDQLLDRQPAEPVQVDELGRNVAGALRTPIGGRTGP
jgi:hypothetical protein